MKSKVAGAVAGAVVAVVVVLGGIFVFSGTKAEVGPGDSQAAGPAPTTRLNLPAPDPSGTKPEPEHPYLEVPSEQMDGDMHGVARTAGRSLYIQVLDGCVRNEVWPRGEHADRVELEIRMFAPTTPPPGVTVDADGSYGCFAMVDSVDTYAVIELAEPLGDRRLVVKKVAGAPPS